VQPDLRVVGAKCTEVSMKLLPDRPDLVHLKKQAKDLLALYRRGEPEAFSRFREALPAASRKDDATIANLGLRLHDAQSCVAREYGFASWADLASFVTARNAIAADPAAAKLNLLTLIYAGDISGGSGRAHPTVAARILKERPDMAGSDLAWAIGNLEALRSEIAGDPGWVNRPSGALVLPPLVAVTHSSLMRVPEYRERLHASAKLLLEAGADPNQSVPNRWMASVSAPNVHEPLSALYGAAGQNRDPALTKLLLDRGADPNDNESLYHSLENPACTRLLLEAGARVTGTNAIYRALDLDDPEPLRLLLANGGDPNEPAPGAPTSEWGSPLLWAIRRRRSLDHVKALLDAGADPKVRTPKGESAYVLAMRFGLPAVAEMLASADEAAPLSPEEQFVAACAVADEKTARAILAERPDIVAALSQDQLRLLPELAASGADQAVRLMVELGWPIVIRGGDWDASALNQAVFHGNAPLARFLLDHGAGWREEHGFGDNACGTLSWASCNEPVEGGDWIGCAEALLASGMPAARRDPAGSNAVLIDGKLKLFSDGVRDVLLAASPAASA
jgi:ankyrin repeat protein